MFGVIIYIHNIYIHNNNSNNLHKFLRLFRTNKTKNKHAKSDICIMLLIFIIYRAISL